MSSPLTHIDRAIEAHGGVTLDLSETIATHDTGYIVGVSSLYVPREKVLHTLSAMLREAQARTFAVTKTPKQYDAMKRRLTVGTYRLPNGLFSVDMGVHFKDLDAAINLAKDARNHSIWDCSEGRRIATGGYGGNGLTWAQIIEVLK